MVFYGRKISPNMIATGRRRKATIKAEGREGERSE
jgi:hypothetical protein